MCCRLPAKPLKCLMGQNVKSPFSNMRARTFKLHPCSSQTAAPNRPEVRSRDEIPIAFLRHHSPAAPSAHYLSTRFRALALFRRRLPERVVRSSLPASENLHKRRHSD